jgi:hypothetical protein
MIQCIGHCLCRLPLYRSILNNATSTALTANLQFLQFLNKILPLHHRLRLDLAELGCSMKGNKEKLQTRLKQAKKSLKSSQNELQNDQNGHDKEKNTYFSAPVSLFSSSISYRMKHSVRTYD